MATLGGVDSAMNPSRNAKDIVIQYQHESEL